MEWITIELVSIVSAQIFPDNTISTFTNFLPAQLNLERQGQVAISEISYPSLYGNVTERKLMFFDEKLLKSWDFCYLDFGLYPSPTVIVEAMNTVIQERHNHGENCITV